jgi:hypothetical protein
MSNVSSTLHQSDIPCSKRGEIIQRKIKGIQAGGAAPGEFKQREKPQEENDPFPLMSKGER